MFRRPGWALARRAAPAPLQPLGFDAVISLNSRNFPLGDAANRAVAAVRQAVLAMPGANWVSVEHHPHGNASWEVEIYPAGESGPGDEATRLRVGSVMAAALRRLPPGGPPADFNPPAFAMAAPDRSDAGMSPAGFADGQDTPPWDFGALPSLDLDAVPAFDGIRASTDADLLARLLGYVTPGGGTEAAARSIMRFGSFAAALSAPELELRELPGLGTHSIAAIKLVHAAALRLSRAAVMHQPVLDGSDALIGYLTAVLARESIEHFRILFLNAEGRLCADEAQARGTVNHTPVYPREVVRRAKELNAASVILVHNHPTRHFGSRMITHNTADSQGFLGLS